MLLDYSRRQSHESGRHIASRGKTLANQDDTTIRNRRSRSSSVGSSRKSGTTVSERSARTARQTDSRSGRDRSVDTAANGGRTSIGGNSEKRRRSETDRNQIARSASTGDSQLRGTRNKYQRSNRNVVSVGGRTTASNTAQSWSEHGTSRGGRDELLSDLGKRNRGRSITQNTSSGRGQSLEIVGKRSHDEYESDVSENSSSERDGPLRRVCNNGRRIHDEERFHSEEENTIARYVRHSLFVELKFITCDMDLYARGANTISRHVMDELQVEKQDRNEWWKRCAPLVKQTLDQKRSNVSSLIGKRFMSKSDLNDWANALCNGRLITKLYLQFHV